MHQTEMLFGTCKLIKYLNLLKLQNMLRFSCAENTPRVIKLLTKLQKNIEELY